MKIFYLEDDLEYRKAISDKLKAEGYEIIFNQGYEDIVDQILQSYADLLLLDLYLPHLNGHQICYEVRSKSDMPILFLSNSLSEADEVFALNLGGQDFVNKTRGFDVVLARIKRLLEKDVYTTLSYQGLEMDYNTLSIHYQGKTISLTHTEFQILAMIVDKKGKIASRDEIIAALWESKDFIEDATLTVNISRLRQKLQEIGLDDFIQTKHGAGYYL